MKDTFDRDGFVIVREFLTVDELSALMAYFDDYIRDVVPTLAKKAFPAGDGRLKAFLLDCEHSPKWKALAESLIGPAHRAYAIWLNKPPGSDVITHAHQDSVVGGAKASVVTIWLALDDVDRENGCLYHIPGSHKLGFRPHDKGGISDFCASDESAGVPIELRAGDAVAHDGRTIHWSGLNTSTRNRRAVQMDFRGVNQQ